MSENKRDNKKVLLSFVLPVFNEESCLRETNTKLRTFAEAQDFDYEIIYVNDGSQDATLSILRELCSENDQVKVVSLSRNFGHQIAVMAGIKHVEGDCVAVMDGDLQDPPAVVQQMLEKWKEGFQVVYGIRRKRKEDLLHRMCYYLFYRLWQKISPLKFPLDAGDFCLMGRRVVEELKCFNEDRPFVRGLRYWVGFKHTGIEYERSGREGGVSKYNIWRLLQLAFDGIFSFSTVLLRISVGIGLALSFLSISYALIVIADRVLMGLGFKETTRLIPGWATLVSGLLFLFGMQFIFMGVLGEYIGGFLCKQNAALSILSRKRLALNEQNFQVSVIIPAFNAEGLIEKCLSALAAQTYSALEILVVDDGSTDGTSHRSRNLARVIRHDIARGPGVARNTGAQQAKGEILAFIDSDCIPPQDWLEKIITAFVDESIGAVGGGYTSGVDQSFWQEFCCKELSFRRRHRDGEVSTLVSNNMACRKQAFFEAGGFPEAFPVGEDMLLSYKISLQHKVLWLADNGVVHHFKNSLTGFLAHQFYFGAESTRLFVLNPQLMVTGNHQTRSLHAMIIIALLATASMLLALGFAIFQQGAVSASFAFFSLGLIFLHMLLYVPFIRFLKRDGFSEWRRAYAVSLLRDLCAGLAIFDGFRRVFIKKTC